MVHTRQNPSQRYKDLMSLYRQMHLEGEKFLGLPAEVTFAGQSLASHALVLRDLIARHGVKTVLDYGSGKGKQYEPRAVEDATGRSFDSIPSLWGARVTCYDPGYEPFSVLPSGKFDAVVCTDVLEHCPEEDIDWIVGELFSFANTFVYANVACYPAAKRLPNGENAHATVHPLEWWSARFVAAAHRHGDMPWRLQVETRRRRWGLLGPSKLVSSEVGTLR